MRPAVPRNPESYKILDQRALSLLLEEDVSTEYCLVAHNRQIEKIELGLWALQLPMSSKSICSQLRSLDLSFNRLHHLGAQSLAPLNELRDLKLYANKLTDEGLATCGLEKLGRLENLELHDNRLRQPPISLMTGGSSKLQNLRLERNQIETLQNLGKCRSLIRLSADGNRLHRLTEKNGSPWLFSCTALETLSLGDNDIDRIAPKAFNGCNKLSELVICRNSLKDDSLAHLAPLAGTLRHLRLEGNHLVSLSKLPQMHKLEEFNVSNNRLVAGGLESLAERLPQMEVLDLAHNRLEGRPEEVLGLPLVKCASLRELSCEGNPCCPQTDGPWWNCLAQLLVQLDLLEDRKVSKVRVENGVAIPVLALTNERQTSARPSSARPLSSRLGTPRGAFTPRGGERPVMHPPSSRTGYGTELKVDTLEDVETLAQGFRKKVSLVRNSIRPSSALPEGRPRVAQRKESSDSDEHNAMNSPEGISQVNGRNVLTEKKSAKPIPLSPPASKAEVGSKRTQLNKALGFGSKEKSGVGVFGDLSEPPPPPRMLKPWQQAESEPKTSEETKSESHSDMKLDLNTLRLTTAEDSVDIPQPSPRYQRETTVERRGAPSANERKATLKKFSIPTQARKQLSSSPR